MPRARDDFRKLIFPQWTRDTHLYTFCLTRLADRPASELTEKQKKNNFGCCAIHTWTPPPPPSPSPPLQKTNKNQMDHNHSSFSASIVPCPFSPLATRRNLEESFFSSRIIPINNTYLFTFDDRPPAALKWSDERACSLLVRRNSCNLSFALALTRDRTRFCLHSSRTPREQGYRSPQEEIQIRRSRHQNKIEEGRLRHDSAC